MRLKELEGELQLVDPFKQPKIHLEQYATSAHIASHMIYTIDQTFDDVKNKVVADFGCGCGMLGIGASFLEADHVFGFDIDAEAMSCAQENVVDFEMEANVDFLQIDICSSSWLNSYLQNKKIINTVVMNPPFGTKHNQDNSWVLIFYKTGIIKEDVRIQRFKWDSLLVPPRKPDSSMWPEIKAVWTELVASTTASRRVSRSVLPYGIDLCFVQQALKVASGAVYSLHKTATRDHILKKAEKDWNATCEILAELKFDLPKTYRFHKKDSLDIHVDFLRFESNL